MFDIGFFETLVIGLILLLVVGPERLPEVARTVGGWAHQARQYVASITSEIGQDLHLSELDQQTRQATDPRPRPSDSASSAGTEPSLSERAPDSGAEETGSDESGSESAGPAFDREPEKDPGWDPDSRG